MLINELIFIIAVLTVAFAIGFITAWLYFKMKWEQPLQKITESEMHLKKRVSLMETEQLELNTKLQQCQTASMELRKDLEHLERDRLQQVEQLNRELAMAKTRNDELVVQNKDMEQTILMLEKQLNDLSATQQVSANNAKVPEILFTDATEADKDDLKKISGIGPFIEKKLNDIGIWTYRQISQFDSHLIDKVTNAIEFFPGRIKRDHWVEQAKTLEAEKSTTPS
jgi:predicted flap endonuclease-1-like 5' DNA nuclease